ncbi:hypothetical protein NN3_00780 [Nocardia neocaledoniensis NBRC 108232]|uniref:Uncharacterized protein n=1 Tax=Nocardia neocaledoniensis TaxID=236511 RepID=A0A317NH52_9NOCA|nr:hypothetical protein [Nocardia neocaledoniensis]PWV74432.1 hypothetical protein DFR69_106243 [Nocardia neocaledoniensis]GEM29071.1 hypothetical protein NN3_00780 [Nocardia neocaledoniensis NBRC 108232]
MTSTRFLAVDKVVHRASIYRNSCGFDVFVRESTSQIVLRVGTVGAIELESAFGQRVVAALPWPGPVIVRSDTTQPRLTILTGPVPAHLRSGASFAALSSTGAVLAGDGDEVLLPSPRDPARRWLPHEPLDPYRPSAEVVVSTILACR